METIMYEVEQKYPIPDPYAVEQRLESLGALRGQPVVQVDTYFGHPARDFAKTDEALRIRRVGERNFVTYKGPKIDRETKTRREIELSLAPGNDGAAHFAELLTALGFAPVIEVRKTRTPWSIQWQSHTVIIAMDEVDGLGFFIELEIEAEADKLDSARAALASLASGLCLSENERRSYMELLLE